jgi:hypothetical protein
MTASGQSLEFWGNESLFMALFAKKCERCGQKTRNEHDNKPVCESCARELDLLVEASRESSRICPIDGTEMSKSIAHMIVVDRCPKCQGVWLDGGELENLYSEASDDALVQMTRGLWIPLG